MITYVREIASGFWSLLAGMAVTIRYFVKPVVTVQYPRQKIEMSPAYRGHPQLLLDPETRTHRCIACEMCARICPSQLITVAGTKLPGAKQKVPYTYVHEHYYCSLCGLCVEVCPTTGTPLYSLIMEVEIPTEEGVQVLRRDLEKLGKELKVEVTLTPVEADEL